MCKFKSAQSCLCTLEFAYKNCCAHLSVQNHQVCASQHADAGSPFVFCLLGLVTGPGLVCRARGLAIDRQAWEFGALCARCARKRAGRRAGERSGELLGNQAGQARRRKLRELVSQRKARCAARGGVQNWSKRGFGQKFGPSGFGPTGPSAYTSETPIPILS